MCSKIQVNIVCVICLLRLSQPLLGQEVDVGELKKLPCLSVVKDVPITWKNNQNQTLSSILGSDVDQWDGRKENTAVITGMYFTAMCCLYSQKIVTIIQKSEKLIKKCKKSDNFANVYFKPASTESVIRCIMNVPCRLQELKPVVFDMLTTVFEYSRLYDETVDKNFLNSLFSIYLYLNNSNRDRSTTDLPIDPAISVDELVDGFKRMNLYILNSIVAFSIRNCSPSTFDEHYLAGKYKQLVFSELKLPATHYRPEFFDLKNIMLTDLLETELIAGKDDTRLKYLTVMWNYQGLQMQHVYNRLTDGFCPESITKFQTVLFDCINSVVFYLITTIVKNYIRRPVDDGELVDPSKASITAAVDVLESFDFPGLGRLTLRKLKFRKPYESDERAMTQTIEKHFTNSKVASTKSDIASLINVGSVENDSTAERLLEILDKFTDALKSMRPYITDAIEMNKTLCDYEYGEVGFQQSAPHQSADKAFSQYTNANCKFAYTVVRHFLMSDFVIAQCESIGFVLAGNVDDFYTLDNLIECFKIMKNSIKSMEHRFIYFLAYSLNIIDYNRSLKPTNRKVIDSILGATLYFNNDRIFEGLLDTANPEADIEEKNVFFNLALSKLENLRHHQALIINLLEHYTVDNCAIPSPRMEFTQSTNAHINMRCETLSDEREQLDVIKCADELIVKNYEAFPIPEPYNNYEDFTFDKLMMDGVFDKSKNPFNGLSMLNYVKVSWGGELKNFEEIRELVKNEMHPKYLIKYQSTTIKAVIFILYEIIKTIVRTSTACKNEIIYKGHTDAMLKALNTISFKHFSLESRAMYKTIVRLFEECLRNVNAVDKKLALIYLIESEQSYLGLVYGFSDNNIDEEIQVIPKTSREDQQYKKTTSLNEKLKKSVTFSTQSLPKYIGNRMENLVQISFQTSYATCQDNIYKLMIYSKNVVDVLPYLNNIAHLLDTRQVFNIIIQ